MQPEDLTFLMVGCSRCGTTWVDKSLREHPQVYLPANKQTYFFDSNYDKGINWYLSHFESRSEDQLAVGEVATFYSRPDVIPYVAKHFPNAKLLLSIRNPVDRAYSYYQSRASKHNWASLEQAIEEQPNEIIERGKYIEQIDAILKHFPEDQLKIVYFDDLKERPVEFLKSILQFIGVDDNFESSQIGQMVQVTIDPTIRKSLKKLGLQPLMNYISARPIGDKIRTVLKKSNIRRYKPISRHEKELLTKIYTPYNKRLEEYTGRTMSLWN